jgi:hypothetical protein
MQVVVADQHGLLVVVVVVLVAVVLVQMVLDILVELTD